MNMIKRIRDHRSAARQAQAIDRAIRSAPSQSMRNEISIFAQRHIS